jgi:hypothetical protein
MQQQPSGIVLADMGSPLNLGRVLALYGLQDYVHPIGWVDAVNGVLAQKILGSGGTANKEYPISGLWPDLLAPYTQALSTEHYSVPTFPYPTGPITLMAWIFPNSATGGMAIAGDYTTSGAASAMLYIVSGRLQVYITTTGSGAVNVNDGGPIVLNAWNHIAMTWDGATLAAYVNGVFKLGGSVSATGTSVLPTQFNLGFASGASVAYKGFWGDVGVWNRCLTQIEIQNYVAMTQFGHEAMTYTLPRQQNLFVPAPAYAARSPSVSIFPPRQARGGAIFTRPLRKQLFFIPRPSLIVPGQIRQTRGSATFSHPFRQLSAAARPSLIVPGQIRQTRGSATFSHPFRPLVPPPLRCFYGFEDDYFEDGNGLLFIADGLSAPIRWDGIQSATYPVGVAPPLTAPSLAKNILAADPAPAKPTPACILGRDPGAIPAGDPSLSSPLIGTYVAYIRYADAFGNYSTLSPVSNTLVLADPAIAAAALAAARSAVGAAGAAATAAGTLSAAQAAAIASIDAVTAAYIDASGATAGTLASAMAALTAAVITANALAAAQTAAQLVATNASATAAAKAAGSVATTATTATAQTTVTVPAVNTIVIASTGALLTSIQADSLAITTAQAVVALEALYAATAGQDAGGDGSALDGVGASLALAVGNAASAAAQAAAGDAVAASAMAAAIAAVAASPPCYGLLYTNVPVPPITTPPIVSREILRNVNGDLNTFYVDLATSDLTSTTFRSSLTDADLGVGIGVSAASTSKTAGISGTYYAYVRFINDLDAPSNLSPISSNTLILEPTDYAYGIAYSNVPVSTQANVVRRQILRNTDGQAATFYVDVDTTDLTSTTFSSIQYDEALLSSEAVPLFTPAGVPLANSHGQPPTWKRVMSNHLGRMFMAVDRQYARGGVWVTKGSPLVQGLNTDWTTILAGRFLWVRGATQSYQILSVDPAAQVITLYDKYTDPTDPLGYYSIDPAPAEARLLYYTMPGQSESWPAINALSLQEDGDTITGLMEMGSFLFILESRHIYRFTFQTDPAVDGFIFLSANRGCVNNRCWVIAEGTCYMMDYSGIHGFDGSTSNTVSDPIQHLWRSEAAGPQINWTASELFFCVHSQDEQYIRWFVCLAGEEAPRHAICLSYKDSRSNAVDAKGARFWIEEYDRPITAGCAGTFDYRRRAYVAGDANRTYLGWQSTLEGIDPSAGVTRATAVGSSSCQLLDPVNAGAWPQNLAGQSVTIVSGRGEGQTRRIVAQDANALYLLTDWQVLPDDTSIYQLGGIPWIWQSGWFRYAKDESDNARRVEVIFDPTLESATLTLRIYRDFATDPVLWRTTRKGKENEGFATVAGSPDLLCEQKTPRGFAQVRMDGHKEMNLEGTRYISTELSGVAGKSPQTVFQVTIDGVTP